MFAVLPVAAWCGAYGASPAGRHPSGVETGVISSLVAKGDSYAKSCPDSALAYYSRAMGMFDGGMSEADKETCAWAHLKANRVYFAQERYNEALEVLVNGLVIAETLKPSLLQARFYNNMGNIYTVHHDYGRAAIYYSKAYNGSRAYADADADFLMLNNLVTAYCYLPDTAKAARYMRILEDLHVEDAALKHPFEYYKKVLGGCVARACGRYAQAVADIKAGLAYALANGMPPIYECGAVEDLYNTYKMAGNADSAEVYIKRLYAVAAKYGFKDKMLVALRVLPGIYARSGDYASAVRLYSEYVALNDSILDQRRYDYLNSLHYKNETTKYTTELSKLAAQKLLKEQELGFMKTMNAAALAVCAVMAVFFVIIYRQKKNIDRAYRGLFEMNQKLIRTEQEGKKERDALKLELHNGREEAAMQPPSGADRRESAPASAQIGDALRRQIMERIRYVMEDTDEYCSSSFTLKRLADLVGSNTAYVSQIVNAIYGTNFCGMVNEYRVREVQRRMAASGRYSNLTLQALAESVGFNSVSTFNSAFKKIVKMTPSRYQKEIADDIKTS